MTETKARSRIVCTYTYTDVTGMYLYEVVRYEPKDFRTRRKLDSGGYSWSLQGVRRVLYRLAELTAAIGQTIYVVEGEKDVDRMYEMGFVATCCQGSTNGWLPEFADCLIGKDVVILPDNDVAGTDYARTVALSIDGKANSWIVVHLNGLPDKGDVSDWFDAGHKDWELADLVREYAEAAEMKRDAEKGDAYEDIPLPAVAEAPQVAEWWEIESIRFCDIKPEQLEWLWQPYWLDHAVNILTGPPGVGKTFVAVHLAACVSRGMAWPDGPGNAPLGDVVFLSSEDSLSKVLRPRLEAAGADLERIHTWTVKRKRSKTGEILEQEISLEDIEPILAKVDEMPGMRLLIIDPVTAFLGSADANDNKEVRRVLNEVVKLAESKRFCVVLITHQKKSVASAINSTMGAQSFVAVARIVNGLFKDPDDEEKRTRLLLPFKNNHGPDVCGKRFRIAKLEGPHEKTHIVWDSEPEYRTADDIMNATLSNFGKAGRETTEEQREAKNQSKFLEVLDAMPADQNGWVRLRIVRDKLGWNGSKLAACVWSLEKAQILESMDAANDLPNGGVDSGGRKLVRRFRHKNP